MSVAGSIELRKEPFKSSSIAEIKNFWGRGVRT